MTQADPTNAPSAGKTKAEPGGGYSLGVKIIAVLAVLSAGVLAFFPDPDRGEMELLTFSKGHADTYRPMLNDPAFRARTRLPTVEVIQTNTQPLSRRISASFWSGTEVGDVIEVERGMIGAFFSTTLKAIGFVDLTDRLESEGLLESINTPSFAPWTTRGRIFGLPHDVHPVMLAYHKGIFDGAGVDVESIETWTDFRREMQKVVAAKGDDGRPLRYGIAMWTANFNDQIEALMLQAGGGTFILDPETGREVLAVNHEANAVVLANVVAWCVGPNRIAIDAPEFNPSANQLKLEGRVAAAIMPDWLAGVWQKDLPGLSGEIRLMPLPAWSVDPQRRRTTVWGGTALMIPSTADDHDLSWRLAKELYLSRELAEELYKVNRIISPMTSMWGEDFYHQPDPYFGGQQPGTLFIELAPDVPLRTSSPFRGTALGKIGQAIFDLKQYADDEGVHEPDALLPEARRLLQKAHDLTREEMDRNLILGSESW
ncbi:MAG: extracellular solute-binding protein [Planctomycetota bacterium]